MSESNLPPGVTEDMLPGNTPEDEAWDAFWDEFDFWNPLCEWAEENNGILYYTLSEATAYMSADKVERLAKEVCQNYEAILPTGEWFEDWCESHG